MAKVQKSGMVGQFSSRKSTGGDQSTAVTIPLVKAGWTGETTHEKNKSMVYDSNLFCPGVRR
jgi:hypothetical protein